MLSITGTVVDLLVDGENSARDRELVS